MAIGLCYIWPVSPAPAQQAFIAPIKPSAPVFWRPYLAPEVPPTRLANSRRLRDLVRGGKIYLTARGAIALALENNIDLEIQRYDPLNLAWRVERFEAGGTLPGVPSVAAQVTSVASGQGVLGSQKAAGINITGSNGTIRGTVNATITQIGPITQTLDPTLQQITTLSHRTLPQPNAVQSITPVLIQDQHIYTASLQQGLLSGGGISGTYLNHYLNENSPTDVLNPSNAATLSVAFQHNLLQGFGVAVNARQITIAKMNLETSDLTFKTQVIGVVVNVLNAYYSLAGDYENVKAKTNALSVAQTFYADNRRQVQIGALAEIEVTRAKSQVASSRQDLVTAQTSLDQHELQLKNLVSRTSLADPVVAAAQIIPVDHLMIPEKDQLPPLKTMVETALANRSDLAAERAGVKTAEVSALGTRNGILPVLIAFGTTTDAGLAGTGRRVIIPPPSGCTPPGSVSCRPVIEFPDPYFVGDLGTALGQIFRHNFPSEGAGAFYQAVLHNRQAQADYAIDQLQLRQTELTTAKDVNQAQVDILNSVVALQQARARYDAALHNRILAEQLFAAERNKYNLGASTPYSVIQQQRDLTAAQYAEISALVSYSSARIALDQALGETLENNHISIAAAREGRIEEK